MLHSNNEKWKTTNDEGIKLLKLRKNTTLGEKGNLQILGNIGNGLHQISRD